MSFFLALLADGILAGAMYALIALAFVLVYQASAMINFALGEWMMFGVLLCGLGANLLQLGTAGALVFAGLGVAAVAAGFCAIVVRRLINRPALSAIMATLGLGMLLRGGANFLPAEMPAFLRSAAGETITIAGLALSPDKVAAAGVAALSVVAVALFYRFSRTGVAVRAMADDPQVAASMGIDLERHLLFVWALAGLVSLVAGVLWVFVNGGGFGVALVGLKVFPIVILGGLNSIPGTFVAAVAVGVLESLASGYLDGQLGSGFGSLAPYVALLAMLFVRPYGLFGSPRVERI
jgi:branched-chain amino acid transport system permease protein